MFNSLLFNKKYSKILPKEVHSKLSDGEKLFLLDVRTNEEYRENHIPQSISLPLQQLKSNIEKIVSSKDAEIVLYCQSGTRAAEGCRLLSAMGYTNIKNMGGIMSWKYGTERG